MPSRTRWILAACAVVAGAATAVVVALSFVLSGGSGASVSAVFIAGSAAAVAGGALGVALAVTVKVGSAHRMGRIFRRLERPRASRRSGALARYVEEYRAELWDMRDEGAPHHQRLWFVLTTLVIVAPQVVLTRWRSGKRVID